MHTKRIARGARWLDRQAPDWFTKVDITRLDPYSDSRCVVGQVFGSFEKKTQRFVPNLDDRGAFRNAVSMGVLWGLNPIVWHHIFVTIRRGFVVGSLASEGEWREAWRHEIKKREHSQERLAEFLYVPEEFVAESLRRSSKEKAGSHIYYEKEIA